MKHPGKEFYPLSRRSLAITIIVAFTSGTAFARAWSFHSIIELAFGVALGILPALALSACFLDWIIERDLNIAASGEIDHLDEWFESVKQMKCPDCNGEMRAVRPGKIECSHECHYVDSTNTAADGKENL